MANVFGKLLDDLDQASLDALLCKKNGDTEKATRVYIYQARRCTETLAANSLTIEANNVVRRKMQISLLELESLSAMKELRSNFAKSQAQVREMKFENRKLKKALKRSSARVESDCVVESIGGDFVLPKSFLDFLKLRYLGKPTFFLRKLVFDSNLFTLEEIAASSLSGKTCAMSGGGARPALDPVRLKVIKDYTVATCGIQPRSLEMEILMSTLRQIPSDARTKLRRRN